MNNNINASNSVVINAQNSTIVNVINKPNTGKNDIDWEKLSEETEKSLSDI